MISTRLVKLPQVVPSSSRILSIYSRTLLLLLRYSAVASQESLYNEAARLPPNNRMEKKGSKTR